MFKGSWYFEWRRKWGSIRDLEGKRWERWILEFLIIIVVLGWFF
jgi:hypothetical protein